ncbi:MAG: adaptor protein MecA, partial [Lachnoclostridium sp.]|nr:adaptor protein MecA [Lachnoclostridium sp.]
MKIERINDNQIRCVLTKNDLMERHLRISELAYGSEKAKEFFRDMMEQASLDFGFEADDIPLMIEAIPTSRDSIVLVITKVEDPDEFEKRFSHFSSDNVIDANEVDIQFVSENDDDFDEQDQDYIDCFDQFKDL